MTSQRRRFSESEFSRAVAISRLEPQSIALAHAVLVKGQPQATAAREAGVARQRASQIISKMRHYIDEAHPVPAGWRTDTVTLPAADWPTVRALEQRARKALDKRLLKKR